MDIKDNIIELFILIFNIIKKIYFIKNKYIKFSLPKLKEKEFTIFYKKKILFKIKLILTKIIKMRVFVFIKNLIIFNTITLK